MARTSAKAKKQRQEANRNRDKGEESADSLPPDNQENIENGAQKEKPSRKAAIKTDQEQEDSDFENDVSDSEKKGKKRGKVENFKRKEKKLKKEKSVSEDEEDETSKNDYENDVSDSEKKGKKRVKVENSKSKEKKVKTEKVESTEEDDDEEASPTADYEVEKIVEVHHKKNGKREFLIRWKGFSSKDDTWEPEEHLDCPALIDRFMAKVDKAKNLSVRELRDQRTRTQRFTPIVPGVRSSHRNQGKARTVFYTE